nr:putative 60S ribosomal protein L39-like 5 [Meriones unguiculatus]
MAGSYVITLIIILIKNSMSPLSYGQIYSNPCSPSPWIHSYILTYSLSSHQTFRIKQFLAKKQKQNCPIRQWIRMKIGNKIRYNSKRRHWKKMKLGL